MANSTFSKIVKSLWVLVAFIPFINGLGFAYIGAKEFKREWIIEGLIYEIPWFFAFVFANNDGVIDIWIGLGLLLMLIGIIRTFIVYFQHKDILIDDDEESQIDIDKSFSSFWVIFSFIIIINGIGLVIVGLKRNMKRWIFEGIIFEFLWILSFITAGSSDMVFNFFLAVALAGMVLSIVRTFMIYFEVEKMDTANYAPKPKVETPAETKPKTVDNTGNEYANSEIIPQFRAYNTQITGLKDTFNQKEENITNLINQRFNDGELSYDRFMTVINSCHKIFYHHADSALSIIGLASDYSERLEEAVKEKISILESINDEMNNLIEELILHDGDDGSEEELDELFGNMDNLINSVKDYK